MMGGWEIKKLSEVCQIKPPKKEAKELLSETDLVSFVPMKNLGIRQKELGLNEEKPLNKVVGSYTYFAENDVLLAKITPCFENGKLGIARSLKNGVGFGSSEYIVFRSKGDVDPEYLFYFLSQDSFRDEGAKVMTGAVGHKRVPKEFIEDQPIPLPSLAEQQRIVVTLDEVFAGVATATANAEKNLCNARELFESTLQMIFSDKGVAWQERSLDKLCHIKHGYAFKGKEFSKDVDIEKPIVITPGNFTEYGKLSFTEKNTKRLSSIPPQEFIFSKGDLVIVMTDLSSKMKILGKPAFIDRDNVLHNQRIGKIEFMDDLLDTNFLYYYFMSQEFLQNIKETATGTMVKHTAPKRILNNIISFPESKNEQKRLVGKLNDVASQVRKLENIYKQKLNELSGLKQSILNKAFTGELH